MRASRPVAILGGVRIPFCRNNTAYADVGNLGMSIRTLGALVEKFGLHGEVLGEVEERIEAGLCDENDAASCGPTLARVRRGEVDSWTLRAQFFARRGKSLVGLESSLSLEPVESGHCRVYRYENTATLVGETLRIETLSRRSDELEGLFACFNTDEHLRVTADEPCAKRTTLVARRLGDL